MTNPNYSAAEIEFLQCLLDRYSGTGNLVRADDNPAFMAIVRKHYGEPLSDRAGMNPHAMREVVEALEKAEKVFLHYADLHKAKGTKDGDQKAAVNLAYSMEMGEALAKLREADQ